MVPTLKEALAMLSKAKELPHIARLVYEKNITEGEPYTTDDERIMEIINTRVAKPRTPAALNTIPTRIGMTVIEDGNIPALVEYDPACKRKKLMQISFPMHVKDNPTAILWKVYHVRDIIYSITDDRPNPVGSMVRKRFF